MVNHINLVIVAVFLIVIVVFFLMLLILLLVIPVFRVPLLTVNSPPGGGCATGSASG